MGGVNRREEEEKEAGGEQGRGMEDWRQGARGEQQTKGASSKSRRGEQEREQGSRGEEQQQEQEQLLWPGCLFDSHCHLNLVLRL